MLEKRLHEQFDATVLIGGHEARGWDIPNRDKLHFVGNGVDLPAIPVDTGYTSRAVGFVGDLRYHPNEDAVCWFCQAVWPSILRAVPDARFYVIGRSPSRAVRRLGRLRGVHVTGEVADVAEHLLRLQVVVVPLRIARGIQNKVLEAMAAARPVVATARAVDGIHAVDGTHVVVADEANTFADRTIRLLDEPATCRSIGQAARDFVARDYDWCHQMAAIERILLPSTSGRSGPTREARSPATNAPNSPDAPIRSTEDERRRLPASSR